jgi:hypothetical protein
LAALGIAAFCKTPAVRPKRHQGPEEEEQQLNEQRVASGISGRVLLGAQDFRMPAFLLLQHVLVEVQAL